MVLIKKEFHEANKVEKHYSKKYVVKNRIKFYQIFISQIVFAFNSVCDKINQKAMSYDTTSFEVLCITFVSQNLCNKNS